MIKFKLVNRKGCIMDTTMAKSFKAARKNFSYCYIGTYKIYNCEDGEWINVRFNQKTR